MTFELLIFSISCSCVFCSKATYAFWVSHVVICCSWVFYVFFVKEATHDFWVSQGLISCSCVFLFFLVRLLMPFEFLMCLFPAHFFGGFSKDTHDCCISHVVICCSWVFSVCFLIGYSWFLSCSCAFCYSWCFFSCSWFFGLYTHVFLPLIGHSWLLSCSWFFLVTHECFFAHE